MVTQRTAGGGDLGGGVGVLRRVLPWVALVIVLWVALALYADYRGAVRASRAGSSTEETSSADSTSTQEATAQPDGSSGGAVPAAGTVTVVADGLNLRTQPSTSASVIKRLPANVKLKLLSTKEGWYQVRDSDGYEGWVAAGGSYTQLDK